MEVAPFTKEQFAELLNGREYRDEMKDSEIEIAKMNNLVVVYGASDDLMELEGSIYEEIGCFDGGSVLIDKDGIIEKPDADNYDDEGDDYEEAAAEYITRKKQGKKIEAIWNTEGYSWIYKTDIPHATFEIMEDGDKYCKGIVFSLNDL